MDLFHKALVFGDPHFGRSANSPQANQDNLDFLAWAIDVGKTWGAETCIMLGDWFDNRSSIGVGTMHSALHGLEMLSADFKRSWFISGNHDQFHKHQREVTSLEFAKHVPNIVLVNDPLTVDDCIFLPWLMPDEHRSLDLRGRYVFGHLEVPGFLRNIKSVMPDTGHAPLVDLFQSQEWSISGHFHKRQVQKNVMYVGNCMPFNFSDDGDADRGIMLLQWGHDPIFRAWPGQPLYRSLKLTELLADDSVLRPNMTVRLTIDMALQYEELQDIREALVTTYALRRVELNHVRDEIEQEQIDVEIQTVDQIVFEGLGVIESVGLSNQRLIEIYQSLI